jgi:hypothetical protein
MPDLIGRDPSSRVKEEGFGSQPGPFVWPRRGEGKKARRGKRRKRLRDMP